MNERRCSCGHTVGQHELRSGGLLGCYISGCLCIDFDAPPHPTTTTTTTERTEP